MQTNSLTSCSDGASCSLTNTRLVHMHLPSVTYQTANDGHTEHSMVCLGQQTVTNADVHVVKHCDERLPNAILCGIARHCTQQATAQKTLSWLCWTQRCCLCAPNVQSQEWQGQSWSVRTTSSSRHNPVLQSSNKQLSLQQSNDPTGHALLFGNEH